MSTAKKHLTLRIDASTIADLDRLSRVHGLSRNELAYRYLVEGVRRQEFPEVYFREGALGRRAALLGTRLDVWQVMKTVREHANGVEEAAAYLGLSVDRVRAAVRYAAAYGDEIADIAGREREASARAEDLWRGEQDLLSA